MDARSTLTHSRNFSSACVRGIDRGEESDFIDRKDGKRGGGGGGGGGGEDASARCLLLPGFNGGGKKRFDPSAIGDSLLSNGQYRTLGWKARGCIRIHGG